MNETIIGFIGVVLCQGSIWLQVYKLHKTRETAGISIEVFWLWFIASFCYLYYAIEIKAVVFIISNIIGIVSTTITVYLYYQYRK
jgi:uncharacterized protein with PQ loop repeat